VFALAFHSKLEYRHLDERINSGDDAGTLCKNLVNFGSVTPVITFICVPSYSYWTKIDLPIFIRRTGIPKRGGRS